MSKISKTELTARQVGDQHEEADVFKSGKDVQSDIDAAYLRATNIIKSINANRGDKSEIAPIPDDYVPRKVSKETRTAAIDSTFEILGGLPFMVAWATKNPTKYMEMWSKHALADGGGIGSSGVNLTIVSAIQAIPQDAIGIDEQGRVIDVAVDDDDELID